MDYFPEIQNTLGSDTVKMQKIERDLDDARAASSKFGDEPDKEKKLKEIARGFESMFVKLLMAQMRQTIPESELIDGGNAQEIFEEMFDDEIGKRISQRGDLGIANALMREFEKQYNSNAYNGEEKQTEIGGSNENQIG